MMESSLNGNAQRTQIAPFGKYLLLEQMAVGGMAEVWLAKRVTEEGVSTGLTDSPHGELLALKRVLPRLAEDAAFIRMFIDEARIAGQLHHPGIVPMHELGRIGDSYYIAMEYVWGRDVFQLMRRLKKLGRQAPFPLVAYIGSKLCEALHYAHTRQDKQGRALDLVHRDVSPQNVLIGFDGHVRLIDFGIAKAASRSTQTQAGSIKGKVGYMSPEATRGQSVDARSDVFGVGTLLYELLTLSPLFARENVVDAMQRVRDARVPPLSATCPECPPELASVILRALALKADDRFQSAEAMQHALEDFLPAAGRAPAGSLSILLKELFEAEHAEEHTRLAKLNAVGRAVITHAETAVPLTRRHLPARPKRKFGLTPMPSEEFDLDFGDDQERTLVADPMAELAPLPSQRTEVFFPERETSEFSRSSEFNLEDFDEEEVTAFGDPQTFTDLQLITGDFTAPEISVHELVAAPLPTRPSQRPPSMKEPAEAAFAFDTSNLDSKIMEIILPDLPAQDRATTPSATRRNAEPTLQLKRMPEVDPALDSRGATRRRSDAIFAVAALAFVVLLAALGYFTWSSSGAMLNVETHPTAALVLVDGAPQGRTPLHIESSAGTHHITLSLDGYQDVTRVVQVASDDVHLMVDLQPSAP